MLLSPRRIGLSAYCHVLWLSIRECDGASVCPSRNSQDEFLQNVTFDLKSVHIWLEMHFVSEIGDDLFIVRRVSCDVWNLHTRFEVSTIYV